MDVHPVSLAAPPSRAARRRRTVATCLRYTLGLVALGACSFALGLGTTTTSRQIISPPSSSAAAEAAAGDDPSGSARAGYRAERSRGEVHDASGSGSSSSSPPSTLFKAETDDLGGADHREDGDQRRKASLASSERAPVTAAPPAPPPAVEEERGHRESDEEPVADPIETTHEAALDWSSLISQTLRPWSDPYGPGITEAQLDMAALAMHEVTPMLESEWGHLREPTDPAIPIVPFVRYLPISWWGLYLLIHKLNSIDPPRERLMKASAWSGDPTLGEEMCFSWLPTLFRFLRGGARRSSAGGSSWRTSPRCARSAPPSWARS
jgi:hypothetical protein